MLLNRQSRFSVLLADFLQLAIFVVFQVQLASSHFVVSAANVIDLLLDDFVLKLLLESSVLLAENLVVRRGLPETT